MTRLTANSVRDIATEFKKSEKEKLKQQKIEVAAANQKLIEDQKRQREIWENLYLSAINGHDFLEVENIEADDIYYFEKIGFNVDSVYKRKTDWEILSDRIDEIFDLKINIENQIQSFEDGLWEYEKNPDNLDLVGLEFWIKDSGNSFHAFACGFEEYFDMEKLYPYNLTKSDLHDLQKSAKEKLNKSKLPDRIKSLSTLLFEIQEIFDSSEPTIDPSDLENQINKLKAQLQQLELEEDTLKNDEPDYQYNLSIDSIDRISWEDLIVEGGTCDFTEYTYQSLRWLCSKIGQEAFENFDYDVKSSAKLGNQKLELKITDSKNSIIVTNENGKLRNTFPRWFDFKESLRLLGYKVSEPVKSSTQVIVRW